MNITIIIPAIQIIKKEPDSPQPTTPFPPISITPSPINYSMTPYSHYDYQNSSKVSRSEFSANIFSESIEFGRSPFDDGMDNSLEYSAPPTQVNSPMPTEEAQEATPEPETIETDVVVVEDAEDENLSANTEMEKAEGVKIQKSDSVDTVTEASTPETVIQVIKQESQDSKEDDECAEVAKVTSSMMMQVPNINFVSATPRVSPEPESDDGAVITVGATTKEATESEGKEEETFVVKEEVVTTEEAVIAEEVSAPKETPTSQEDPTSEPAGNEMKEFEEEVTRTEVGKRIESQEAEVEKAEEVMIPIHPITKLEKSKGGKKSEIKKKSVEKEKVVQRRRTKPFPDPRKPSNYPQRLNKVTLARQALAREKRRVYVEERIQSYIRGAQTGGPNNTLVSSNTQLSQQYTKPEKTVRTDPIVRPTAISQTDAGQQMELGSLSSTNSLPDIDQNYFMNNSYYLPTSPKPFSAMSVARVPTRKSSSLSSLHKMHSIGSTGSIPHISFNHGSQKNIYVNSIPEENAEWWKGVSEQQGFFYSFRVRQSGPVQMLDKSVQTHVGESHSEGFTINFTPNARSSVFLSRKMERSYSSFTNLPVAIDDRDKILREITETVQLRHDAELRRAELVQRANDLQTRVKEKRDKITRRHEFWHKKYIEESSLTRPLEASCSSLRAELNTVHRRLLAHLEGRDLPLRLRDGPSKKANYKIMAARLQHEIKELQQKVKAAKLRLESEIKLKEQADREVRDVRNDLSHKKVVMSLARSQVGGLPPVHPRPHAYEPLIY